MKRIIWLAAAAALVAAGLASAEGEDNGSAERGAFAASLRLEGIFPAAGFDYMFAKRVSVGPILKYDVAKFVAAAESRLYFLGDYESTGFKPYLFGEAGWQTGSDPPAPRAPQWYWGYAGGDGADAAENDEPLPYRFYAFAGPGVDLRTKGLGLVPFMEMGPRREFREGNEGIFLYWALGLRYTW